MTVKLTCEVLWPENVNWWTNRTRKKVAGMRASREINYSTSTWSASLPKGKKSLNPTKRTFLKVSRDKNNAVKSPMTINESAMFNDIMLIISCRFFCDRRIKCFIFKKNFRIGSGSKRFLSLNDVTLISRAIEIVNWKYLIHWILHANISDMTSF